MSGGNGKDPPTTALAHYRPPAQRARRPRGAALVVQTYRLTLSREADGKVLHEWAAIPHDKVVPLLSAMQRYLPLLAKAAAAKQAWDKLMELLH